ncbi:MAG: N-6 DNA methylase [Gammaproteobacteria bacterium]|nr:N-6 DNA methylase [Gammaproteobacteria bacterium]
MSIAKTKRAKKRQLGQFITPPPIAGRLVSGLAFTREDKVLEPSFGDGSFILPLIEKFMSLYDGDVESRLSKVLSRNVYGSELDTAAYSKCLKKIKHQWGFIPRRHNLINGDFFRCHFLSNYGEDSNEGKKSCPVQFSHIVGNPPFGGTFDLAIQDDLDKELGFRNGMKIKKETYSFFIVKSVDMLRFGGQLTFICSDTFLTISTMRGLRNLLMSQGEATVTDLPHFSEETSHPMVVLQFHKNGFNNAVCINGTRLYRQDIDLTDNFSWRITSDLLKYFDGPRLGRFMVATSGMTVGGNERFVRKINNGKILEPYRFEYYEDPITLDKEISRARLGYLAPCRAKKIKEMESMGVARRNVRFVLREEPLEVAIPNPDYRFYNKGCRNVVYVPPQYVIYWKDDGDAVLTFKRNGNWYLRGVGGKDFFKREGLTWQLIAQNLHVRYLPEGYILDSGSPCAFLRESVKRDEFYFIFGWALTALCNRLLKEVINHTKNIQSKDFERLPYPFWVAGEEKSKVIGTVKNMIEQSMNGRCFNRDDEEILSLEKQFAYIDGAACSNIHESHDEFKLMLF